MGPMRFLALVALAAEVSVFPLLPLGPGDKGELWLRLDGPGGTIVAAYSHNRGTLRVHPAAGESKLPRASGGPDEDAFMGAGLTVTITTAPVEGATSCPAARAAWLEVTSGETKHRRLVCREPSPGSTL